MAGPKTNDPLARSRRPLGGVALGALRVPDVVGRQLQRDPHRRHRARRLRPGDCSLREAIEAANAVTTEASTITLPAGMYVLSIAHRLSMTQQITITGAGSATTIVDGNHLVGVFDNANTGDQRGHDSPRPGYERARRRGIHNGGTSPDRPRAGWQQHPTVKAGPLQRGTPT